MLIFISPFFLIPIALGLILAWALWAVLGAVIARIRRPKVIYTPKTDSPELIEAIRSGYSPRLGLSVSEIFPDTLQSPDIDRILEVRGRLFPIEVGEFFYSVGSQDLTPTEFKNLALRLFLEMAFIRSYLLEKSPRLWPQKTEEIWIYHTPKPLRKLAPDYYRQLLTQWKQNTQTTRSPVAV